MKQSSSTLKLAVVALAGFGLAAGKISNAEGKPVSGHAYITTAKSKEDPKEKKPEKKSKVRTASFASRNNDAVRIYPDIIKREMHVVAKDNKDKEVTFFVFDLQGTLLHQYKMKAKDHYRISGLKKGIYIYRVFSGDEETATGKFEIR